MKTIKIIAVFTVLNMLNIPSVYSQYLNQNQIPIIVPTIQSSSDGYVYFDLSRICTTSTYSDFLAVSDIRVIGEFHSLGTWNRNLGNGNFEQFYSTFYPDNTAGMLNDVVFTILRPDSYKDVIIIRNSELKVYQNTNGVIQYFQTVPLDGEGFNLDTGYFSTEGIHADLVVRVNDNELQFFKNNINGYLLSLYTCNPCSLITGVKMRQIDDRYKPYIPNDPTNRDDIIISRSIGTNLSQIIIYRNDNQNGLGSVFDQLDIAFTLSDFEIADFDEDGFNDLIVSGDIQGKDNIWIANLSYIYKNVQGQFFNHNPIVQYNSDGGYAIGNITKIAVADFNKDGWNDLIFTSEAQPNQENEYGRTSIFINQKTAPLFRTGQNDCDQQFHMTRPPWDTPIRVKTCDIYNTGGLAYIASYVGIGPDAQYGVNLVNAINQDPPPAPPIVQASLQAYEPDHYRPKLIIHNRGEKDFLHYHIFKFHPPEITEWQDVGTTDGGVWIDDQECVELGGDQPLLNCFYSVKSEDLKEPEHQKSDFSKEVGYRVDCDQPMCAGCVGDKVINNIYNDLPLQFELSNYPNPFNPATKIKFALPAATFLKLEIYDVLGRRVSVLVNEYMQQGLYNVEFDGSSLASGIYIYRIRTHGYTKANKMLLLK